MNRAKLTLTGLNHESRASDFDFSDPFGLGSIHNK